MAEREHYIDFATHPERYKHWKLCLQGRIARLAMDVQEDAPLVPGYELKLNSYDLGVDIELYDAVQRLRFEHPEVAAVITSAKPRVFCAGANIRMLAQSSHAHKVNFCKFTNEPRNSIEDASAHAGQTYLCAINGMASGAPPGSSAASPPCVCISPSRQAQASPSRRRRPSPDPSGLSPAVRASRGRRKQRAVESRLIFLYPGRLYRLR
jgi:hypothetical protein